MTQIFQHFKAVKFEKLVFTEVAFAQAIVQCIFLKKDKKWPLKIHPEQFLASLAL
jgi:hypothetical protein